MPKLLESEAGSRRKLAEGVDRVANAVRVTLGPRGRNVAIFDKRRGRTKITNDGTTIAREIELEDPWHNMGAELIKEVAAKTTETVGDGSTTATVLAQAMIRKGLHLVAAGAEPCGLKRGIEQAVAAAVGSLRHQTRPINDADQLAHVAGIAANSDPEIADIVARAFEKLGKDGVVTIEESHTFGLDLKFIEGIQFDRGFLSAYFINDDRRREAVLDETYILFTDRKMNTARDVLPVLEKVKRVGKPLLVIAEDLEDYALATLVVNKMQGRMQTCAVKPPGFGDFRNWLMRDMAIATGGRLISAETGDTPEGITLEALGRARRAIVTKDSTTIIEGQGDSDKIKVRVKQIRSEMERTQSEWDREKLQKRLAKLTHGVAVVKAGAASEVELKEKRQRIQAAVEATRAALQEGILPGGGTSLVRARDAVEALKLEGDEALGAMIVFDALKSPLWWIAQNAGFEGGTVVEHVARELDYGFDAQAGEYVDLVKTGIIDPTRVTRCALENASSVAALVLTTAVAVVEKPKPRSADEEHAHQHMVC